MDCKRIVRRALVVFVFVLCGSSLSTVPDDRMELVGHWQFLSDYRDRSGRGNHALNHGAELTLVNTNEYPAAKFDGKSSWIEVPKSESLTLGTKDFSIAAWVHTSGDAELDDSFGDIVSQYDPVTRRGFTLGISHNTGVTTNQANTRNIYFGIDNGRIEREWTDHGRLGDAVLIYALAVHDGSLFAGTCEAGRDQAGHVYRFDGGRRWIDCGMPDRCNAVSALAVFDGHLYAGVSKYRLAGSSLEESENPNPGGSIYRYGGGTTWERCGQLPDREAIGGLVVFRGRLYASSLYKPAGFFRYEGGSNWTSLETPNGKRVEALCVFDGELFATSYDEAHVYRYNGKNWHDCGQLGDQTNTQTYSFAIYEGRLYVGTWRSGRVFRYRPANDDAWEDMGRLGEELEVMGMIVHNGKLFAGTLPLAEVYRFDGQDQWSLVGRVDQTPDVRYRRAWTMAQFRGRLFCGTLPSGRVLSIEAGRNVTYDYALAQGWHHVTVTKRRDQLKLYVDGKSVAISAPFDPADFDVSADGPLKIGFGPTDHFRGRLRDLRIYRRALADHEVMDLANSSENGRLP